MKIRYWIFQLSIWILAVPLLSIAQNKIIKGSIAYKLTRAAGYNTNVVLLNGYIAKSLFKEKQALVKLYGYDLLHQNVSITRNIGDKTNALKTLCNDKLYLVF